MAQRRQGVEEGFLEEGAWKETGPAAGGQLDRELDSLGLGKGSCGGERYPPNFKMQVFLTLHLPPTSTRTFPSSELTVSWKIWKYPSFSLLAFAFTSRLCPFLRHRSVKAVVSLVSTAVLVAKAMDTPQSSPLGSPSWDTCGLRLLPRS